MKQLFSFIVFVIILAFTVTGQVRIKADNCQPGFSNGEIDVYVLISNSAILSGNPVTSTGISMMVNPGLVAGTIAANQSIGYNTIPALLTASPPTGGTPPYTYQWQSSLNSNVFYNIQGATSLNYQPGALTATTWYRQNQFSAVPGDSVTTNTIAIAVYGASVEDLASAIQRIYPNPTPGNFILELNNTTPADLVTVDVYGICGEKLISEVISGEQKHNFSLSGRPAGVYFICVTSGKKTETVKIIKQ